MQLTKTDYEDGFYTLEFRKVTTNTQTDLLVVFENNWEFSKQSEDEYSIGEVAGTFKREEMTPFPHDMKKNLFSIPLHIPSNDGRQIFKSCMDFFIKRTHAPIHVAFVEHPGYPLVVVSFNSFVIAEMIVTELIEAIMYGIREASLSIQEIEKEEVKQEEDIDEIDENNIIEYEEDEELKAVMKPPVDRSIKPIDGGEIYD